MTSPSAACGTNCQLESTPGKRTVEEVGDPSIKRLTRALSHFVPQLALPKRFDTTNADALLGCAAPAVRTFWEPMLDHLLAVRPGASHNARAA